MKTSALVLTLLFCGCATVTFLKIDKDGYYRFKNQPIEVKAPFPVGGDFSVFDTDTSVDFVLGAGYWMAFGQYAVQVFPRNPALSYTREAFLKRGLDSFMKTYIAMDRKAAGFNFEVLKIEATEVNGRPAVRAIGVDRKAKTPAILIATSILFDSRAVIASVVYSLEKTKRQNIDDFDTWPTYNAWIATIAEKMPNQSSEPTPPSVTSRAAARLAPAGVVAHLSSEDIRR